MRFSIIAVVLIMLGAVLANGQTTDPKKLKDQITGDASGKAGSNPLCKLFTPTEIAAYVGAQVGPGENAVGGCNWHNKNYSAFGTVSVVPKNYFPLPTEVKGFKRLPNIGSKGYVEPDSTSWGAAAIVEDVAVVVLVSGKTATEAAAVALLEETIKRRKQ